MKQMRKGNLTGVLVLLVLAVFLVCAMLVLLTGADIVQKLTRKDQENYLHRTAVQYVTMRVHQADEAGMVSVRRMEERDVLVLAEQIDGCRYETLVYYYDDHLREMFCQAGSGIPLEFGEQILELDGFTARMDGAQLDISLQMADGGTQRMLLHLRSGLEADNEE